MKPRAAWRAAGVLGVTVLLTAAGMGCYSYQPMIAEGPVPGEEVRVRLSNAAAAQISERTGRPIRTLEGSVLRVVPDSVQLDVGWGAVFAGTPFANRRDTLAFQHREILEVDRKEFSRLRTGILGAGLAGILASIILTARAGGSGGGPGDGGTDPF